jgi:hypothetical protein
MPPTGGPIGGILGGGGGTGGLNASGRDAAAGTPTSTADSGAIGDPFNDAGGGGAPPDLDAGTPDGGPGDGGVGPMPCVGVDAGVSSCAGFGCGTSLSTLAAVSRDGGACATPEALPLACDGAIAGAALACTQDNVFGLGFGRPVTACLRRLPNLAQVSGDCLECYAQESVCTLSHCFVACIDGSDPMCQQCRQTQCMAQFSTCSGLPALR